MFFALRGRIDGRLLFGPKRVPLPTMQHSLRLIKIGGEADAAAPGGRRVGESTDHGEDGGRRW